MEFESFLRARLACLNGGWGYLLDFTLASANSFVYHMRSESLRSWHQRLSTNFTEWITDRWVIQLNISFKYRAWTLYNSVQYFVYQAVSRSAPGTTRHITDPRQHAHYPTGQRESWVADASPSFWLGRGGPPYRSCPRCPWRMIWGSVVHGGECDSICFKSKS